MEYTSEMVENLLRNYYSLQSSAETEFAEYYIDIHASLMTMKKESKVLYSTIVNVFVNGVPIQQQAAKEGITSRQVSRRLHDGLDVLTMIMNGELYAR